jgi:MFS family permease
MEKAIQHPEAPRSLCGAMVVQFAAGGAIIPFITLLLRDRGLDFGQISLVFSASSATLLVFPFLWGMLADKYLPLNRLFAILNLLACGALISMAFQTHFLGLLLGFTLFYACFNPTLTLINALSFHHLANPREQFGALRAWGSFGWILPFLPISLWLIRDQNPSFDFVLYLSMALCLAMAVLTFWLPHTPPGAAKTQPATGLKFTYGPAVKKLLLDWNYVAVLASFFLIAGSFSLLIFYSPPFLEDLGVPRPWIGPVQAIGVILEILLFRWQGVLIRRWNYTTVIVIGCLALVGRHLLYVFLNNPWILSFSYLLAGMVIVFYHTGVSVLVNTMARVQVRATAQTLLLLFGSGLGPMFANWAAGRLAMHYGGNLRPVFLLAAVMAGLAALLILIRGRHLNAAGNPPSEVQNSFKMKE